MDIDLCTGSEQTDWEELKAALIRIGRPLHPALRYPDWSTFCAAGKPWHNHGDPAFSELTIGARWRERAAADAAAGRALADRSRRRALEGFRAWQAAQAMQASRPTIEPLPEPAPEIIPAAARWKLLADAVGGYGATGLTPTSPDRQIREHLDGIARNGFKPPPGLSLA